ncbi:exodeoxyribonuclease V subunit gamma, partial [Escherichia coli]|nr:exodeoxyribonuclease V subunit gamma [Escherichia coli]
LLALLVDAAGEQAVDDAQFVEPTGSTLLERWQAGILRLTEPAPGSLVLGPADRSIEVHVCHSRMRELEVLHDRLLGLFAQDPSLAPGDVLVA